MSCATPSSGRSTPAAATSRSTRGSPKRRCCRRAPGRAAARRRWSVATKSSACSPAPSTPRCGAGGRSCSSSWPRRAWARPASPKRSATVAECDHGVTVLEGRCVPYGEANVWWPVAEALRSTCEVNVGDPVEVARPRVEARTQSRSADGDRGRDRARDRRPAAPHGLRGPARRHRSGTRPRGSAPLAAHVHRRLRAPASRGRAALRPALGRRPRARSRRPAARTAGVVARGPHRHRPHRSVRSVEAGSRVGTTSSC